MTLINTPFQDGGIYCNGRYIYGDTNYCHAITPQLADFSFQAFSIRARFKVLETNNSPRPVFVGGNSYRWVAFNLNPDGTVSFLYNNNNTLNSNVQYVLNTWHEATITYDSAAGTGKFYLDTILVDSVQFQLIHGNDRTIGITNFSNGAVFKGILSDLRIYSTVVIPSDGTQSAFYRITNTSDQGPGSLREAISHANTHPGLDSLIFEIEGTGPYVIRPSSPLPTIIDSVLLDGTTQPGFSSVPIIELDGSLAGSTADGLRLQTGGSTIKGLVINRFAKYGLVLDGSGTTGNVVQGNFIGTNAIGTAALANGTGGVLIAGGASNNIVGGTTSSDRNLISGNNGPGVTITGAATSNNKVLGNYIGTTVPGGAGLGNSIGVSIDSAANTAIGSTVSNSGNLISGNSLSGIYVAGSGTTIQGNFIGTDYTGSASIPNGVGGGGYWAAIFVNGPSSNTLIGGSSPLARNVISGNQGDGIGIWQVNSIGVQVLGNYIGVQADGTSPLGNTVPSGVAFYGAGVSVRNYSSDITIGGLASGEGNVIANHTHEGVVAFSGSHLRILGNSIHDDTAGVAIYGVDSAIVSGNSILSNIAGGVILNGATHAFIGGTTPAERNVISGNGTGPAPLGAGAHGISLIGSGTTANRVFGNYIGTDPAGTSALPNSGDGIEVYGGASNNVIGGITAAARNVISANGWTGTAIFGSGTISNTVLGNYIGLDATGTQNLGHVNGSGVYIGAGATNNRVGGTVPGSRNFISGNTGWAGVAIDGTSGNVVVGNYIGTDIIAAAPFGNLVGVRIYNGASGNRIGGTATGEGNLIVYSAQAGVVVLGGSNNAILSNSIHSNSGLGIDLVSCNRDTLTKSLDLC